MNNFAEPKANKNWGAFQSTDLGSKSRPNSSKKYRVFLESKKELNIFVELPFLFLPKKKQR
ncbi:MAG: hypothetical protein EAZ14_02565 [Runella slithyformis]|nr:MAG: hypothetical protein EAZ14_02565 [Runella slithyformis]